ncbi:hypothetical protein [Sorangium sp. So ce131]|uniref:hypothetical protein n=1 Tax=Sorangium sp. So ce131 TaxID=3133282 RepID=UPI003F5EC1DA
MEFYVQKQIVAAAPGWFAVFGDEKDTYEEPVACWALVIPTTEYQDSNGRVVKTTEDRPDTVGLVPTESWLEPANEHSNFKGYRGPGTTLEEWLKIRSSGSDDPPGPQVAHDPDATGATPRADLTDRDTT